ncbi:protein kinase [Asticcacaulis sp. AC460]|uniref:leucine-rich repeat-containing protein kinase family protein n=1 Tax=Asticcacaulis sp. AC460 TaxID=1282360 RepID=UPI0003C3FE0B|nr:leucine-rich repeat-containing protein kinase family protein [Asticcacaulis sp. AC460]ESQ87344.1 protein kinase [Asticcacaulis sp. AC460]
MTQQTLQQLRSGALTGATRLKLCEDLTVFPKEIYDLANTLEILDLSGNALTSLPHDLSRLHRLRVLFGSGNSFTALPETLGTLPNLEMIGFRASNLTEVPAAALPAKLRCLILTDNHLTSIPDRISACDRLQKLMLTGNRLTTLPQTLTQCRRLELLRIAANQFTTLPTHLLDLPRLSWLACAGNPFTAAAEANALSQPRTIDWTELELGARLGEGASGVIHRANHNGTDVAVKLFKNAITSDGRPASEMAAGLAAGDHPNLVSLHGRLTGHPEGRDGTIMPLLAPRFRPLAAPPSFDTCTRDVYAADAVLDAASVMTIALTVAQASAHLHARGILNGDLYAHNILFDGREVWLSDLGAASLYEAGDTPYARSLQSLDVRAFGCLLEELAAVCVGDLPRAFHDLTDACLSDDSRARPPFSDAVSRLV